MAAAPSVVGRPSASKDQPSGIGRPFWKWTATLPNAALANDRSRSIGISLPEGIPIPTGLIPRILSIEPHGAMVGSVLVVQIPIISSAMAMSA